MIDAEHVSCPKCGYDLRGIPEERCPECGFRYDRRAIRWVATLIGESWEYSWQRSIFWSVLAVALTVPVFWRVRGSPASLLLLGVLVLRERYIGASPTQRRGTWQTLALIVAGGVLLSGYGELARWSASASLGCAWVVYLGRAQ